MKIGITCIVKGDTHVFSNGLLQNILIMRDLYEKCHGIDGSYLINVHTPEPEEFKGTYWENNYSEHFITLEEAAAKCDIIVVAGGFVSKQNVDTLRKNGKKVVLHTISASLSLFTEKVLFSEKKAGVYDSIEFDAVWIKPDVFYRDQHFAQVVHRCPVLMSPFVWSPKFIEEDCRKLSFNGYAPSGSISKRFSTVEPNINMVKTCIVPLTILEKLERSSPENIKQVLTFCTSNIKENKDFVDFAGNLDIHKNKKARFVGRFPLVKILKEHTDVVLFHQNQCELNYAYFDAAWLGYPIVHNSPVIPNLGWYYPDNDADTAVSHLRWIANHFDTSLHPDDIYLESSRRLISSYLVDSNVEAYEGLIYRLFST